MFTPAIVQGKHSKVCGSSAITTSESLLIEKCFKRGPTKIAVDHTKLRGTLGTSHGKPYFEQLLCTIQGFDDTLATSMQLAKQKASVLIVWIEI
jgi:hypothetical protein